MKISRQLINGKLITTADNWKLNLLTPRQNQIEKSSTDGRPPILCIHGFSQNQLTWTAGGFLQQLIELEVPTYILELRGHGLSAPHLQSPPLPIDLNYRWDLSSFLFYDLPAAIEYIRSLHPEKKPLLCGHSMGGILSLAYALRYPDKISAVITLGAPIDASKISPIVLKFGSFTIAAEKLSNQLHPIETLPIDRIFKLLLALHFSIPGIDKLLSPMALSIAERGLWPQLWNPALTPPKPIKKLLRYADPEPLGVVRDFIRWARNKSLDFGRTLPIDYQKFFPQFEIPFLGIWGESDALAPPSSGENFYRKIQSNYRKFITIPKASHLDLIAGKPIQKIVTEISNLLSYIL